MLFNIQFLRAFAAALIIWVHAQNLIASDSLPSALRDVGYGGVDLFFVISGFIMVYITDDRGIGPISFMAGRVKRITPLYYFFTLLVAVIALLYPDQFGSTSVDIGSLTKSLLFAPFQKSAGKVYPLYYLGWTLNFEMFFYLLFAASLFLTRSVRTISVVGVLLILAIIGRSIENLTDYGVAAFFYTRPIVLDFAAGMLIAKYLPLFTRRLHPAPWWLILALGTIWFILGEAVFKTGSAHIDPPTDTLLRFGIPSALIVIGAVGLERSGVRIGTRWTRRLGDASYSLYLSHYLFIAFIIAVAGRLALTEASRVLLLPVAISGAFFGGLVTHHLVERPLMGDFSTYRRVLRTVSIRTRSNQSVNGL
jgi:exopolysaccharide production protein ExoZ